MKIALVVNGSIRLPWTAQGNAMEVLTYEFARNLASNCDVIVYCQKGHSLKNIDKFQEVTYRRISTNTDKWYTFLTSKISYFLPGFSRARAKKPFFSSKLYYFTWALQIAKDLKSQNCDIVHIHNLSQLVPIIRKFNPKIKIILHMHNEWLIQLSRELIENRLRETDLILSCSEYITNKTRKYFPQFSDICRTLHNGVDVDKFVSIKNHHMVKNKDIKKILSVGRNSPEKGLHILMEAFTEVIKYYPDVKLEIIGPQGAAPMMRGRELIINISDDPKVKKLAPLYNKHYLLDLKSNLPIDVNDKILYTGFVPRKELIKRYQNADVFAFPSIWEEPFGMPVVEAMSTGTPVVSTRVGGINEIVEDGKTGILVNPGNSTELSKALIELLSNEELNKSMGMAARRRAVQYFSWERLSRILLDYYNSVL